jgi:hypothetical protein
MLGDEHMNRAREPAMGHRSTFIPRTLAAAIVIVAADVHAVALNPHGVGQVLIYPYYTVNRDQDTLVSVTNATNYSKVVLVVVREGMNGRPVSSFRLYLSPADVWTARISAAGSDEGAFIATRDRSCTWPALGEQATPFGGAYLADGGPTGLARTREGMIEFIELAQVGFDSALEATIVHNQTGLPNEGVAECAPQILADTYTYSLMAPGGGLFGSASVVNVGEGTFFAYNADALTDFSDSVLPGEEFLPWRWDEYLGLARSGEWPTGLSEATVMDDDGSALSLHYASGIDAVSAVFMANAVYNDILVAAQLGANTDWILTFPTRAFYVDYLHGGNAAAWPPFALPATAARSDVAVYPYGFDQEEGYRPCPECEVSPPPPAVPTLLSWQVNVLSFRDATRGRAPSNVLGSRLATSFEPFGEAGWVHLDLEGGDGGHALPPDASGVRLHGLPVTGFMVYNIVNSNAAPGRLANYGGVFRHRTTIGHSQARVPGPPD